MTNAWAAGVVTKHALAGAFLTRAVPSDSEPALPLLFRLLFCVKGRQPYANAARPLRSLEQTMLRRVSTSALGQNRHQTQD
jgi:hypothetical protein